MAKKQDSTDALAWKIANAFLKFWNKTNQHSTYPTVSPNMSFNFAIACNPGNNKYYTAQIDNINVDSNKHPVVTLWREESKEVPK